MFDNHVEDVAKAWELKKRAEGAAAIVMNISHFDQPLPLTSEFPKFWASSEKKILNRFFIACFNEEYQSNKPLYLIVGAKKILHFCISHMRRLMK